MTPPMDADLKRVQTATRQVNALSHVLQTADRGLSGDAKLRVRVVDGGQRIAWTDGETINLGKSKVLDIFQNMDLAKAILTFKGTNYHELAHVLFTPRKGDAISQWIEAEKYRYKWAWNALEDQRIETLYTALYPPTVPYFLNSSYRWLLDNTYESDNFYRVYSLVGGRKYLDLAIRLKARSAFAEHYGADVADEVDAIVDEYVTIPLPGKCERAIELVKRFHELLKGTDQEKYLDDQGCASAGIKQEGEVDPSKVVEASARASQNQEGEKDAQDQAKQKDRMAEKVRQATGGGGGYPEDEVDEDEAQEPASGGSAYPEDEDDGWDEGEDEDDTQDGSGGAGEEEDEDSDEDGHGEGSAGMGSKDVPQDGPEDVKEDMRDAITEALADTLASEELQEDVDRTISAFKSHTNGAGRPEEQPEYTKYTMEQAQPETIATVAKITALLRTLRTDAEPKWMTERTTGARVNVDHAIRHMADPTHLEIFEEWDEGTVDEASTEVVIAIDLSISMERVLPQCSEALWALQKSFGNADIRTTVLGFSSGNTVLYGPDEKISGVMLRRFQKWSGTDPRDTMLYAHRVLTNSQATNKVLVVITDGIWTGEQGDGADPENVVAALNKVGASTLLFGVNGHRCTNGHGFQQTADLTEIGDIVKVVRDLVKGIQTKANAR